MKWEDLREVGRKSGYKTLTIWHYQSDDCLINPNKHHVKPSYRPLHMGYTPMLASAKEYELEGESLLLLQHQDKDKPIV